MMPFLIIGDKDSAIWKRKQILVDFFENEPWQQWGRPSHSSILAFPHKSVIYGIFHPLPQQGESERVFSSIFCTFRVFCDFRVR
jgi:hypothetical protein